MVDRYFRLTWKRMLAIVGLWLLAVVLHNAIYAVFYSGTSGDEPFFFIFAVIIIPLYVIASLIYTIISLVQQKKVGQ